MAGPGVPAFSLRVGPFAPGELTVDSFSGTEGLSRLYDFQIDFHPMGEEPLEVAELLGTEALLTFEVPGGSPRCVHGKVRSAGALGHEGGRWRYRVWVVPQLWWLTRVHKSRIFQSQTVPDILQQVLGEAGVEIKLSLSGSYEAREYCTQYRETDFAFLSRLMEWEGLFYFFEHSEGGHTLVVGDTPSVHEVLPGGATLPMREDDGHVADGEYFSSLRRVHRLRPGKVHLKDYDFQKPSLDVSGKGQDSSHGVPALEVYDYPGEYVTPAAGKSAAKVRLEEGVQAACTLEAEAVCPRLTPGYRFEVEDDGTHAGEYLVVEVMHTGRQPAAPGSREAAGKLCRSLLKCMPSQVPYRPRRTTPRPHIPGVQTATVVGPAGEEIHTDEHGRIKVQFHWDREGQRDEKASCWVRVGQAWGGPAWGALYLPRIGQEVVVRFLEGNPDRPLIAGTVYNGQNPTPYALPDERTKSTLKSASSLGSNGFNEFRIEDSAGQEEIFVHAQKDKQLLTENDKEQRVRGFEDLLVKKDRKRTVEGHQRLAVTLEDESLVEGSQSLQVRGNRGTLIMGSHGEGVEANQSITVAKTFTSTVTLAASEVVGAARALSIGASSSVNVTLATTEAVGGLKSVEVGGASLEYVLGSRQEVISKDKETKVGGDFQTEVNEGVTLAVGKDLKETLGKTSQTGVKEETAWLAKSFDVKADKFSIIVNGKLALQIEKSGKVQLFGAAITLEGS
jgi:type VI secretion system secreted protein VgrG